MRLFGHANYRYIENRKKAYVLSAIAILAGIVGMIVNVFTIGSWQNYGVDFTGGSLVQVAFTQEVTAGQVRQAVPEATEVARFEGQNEFVIRSPLKEGMTVEEIRAQVEKELTGAFGDGSFRIDRTELVGPTIGAELQQKAGLAILFSFLLTLIYLAIRFETRFGFAAVIATAHDIMITLGFLAIFRVEIDLPTVAAILTIVGYSLNDTIVVFDRIREELGKKGAKKEDQIMLINRSINETLPRTVLTALTTLVVLLALLFLGPAVIRDFSLVLSLGIFVGTFSSIFVASPALVEIRARWGEGGSKQKRRRAQTASV